MRYPQGSDDCLCNEPPVQHGLRVGDLSGGAGFGVGLCGGGMGAGLAAQPVDQIHWGPTFIRRKSRGALYRKVLARYVQMATAGGVNQAMYPEGGLSLNGKFQPPQDGLCCPMSQTGLTPRASGTWCLVPVAINYDRVLEDTCV